MKTGLKNTVNEPLRHFLMTGDALFRRFDGRAGEVESAIAGNLRHG